MSTSEHGEIMRLCDDAFQSMGGVGTAPDLAAHVRASMPDELRDYLYQRGVASMVQRYLRTKGTSGLPQAPEVDDHGTHMQLELMSVEEYRFVVNRCVRAGRAYVERAHQYAAHCQALHGVRLAVDLEQGAA